MRPWPICCGVAIPRRLSGVGAIAVGCVAGKQGCQPAIRPLALWACAIPPSTATPGAMLAARDVNASRRTLSKILANETPDGHRPNDVE